MKQTPLARLLIIAGSDPSGGAGIQADIKTATALGTYAMAAITALTAQNTLGVSGIHAVPAVFVASQIDDAISDIGADSIKTGMLLNAEIIQAVAQSLAPYPHIPLVLDPVMVSKSGARLLNADAESSLQKTLLPRATVLTPNLPEAEALLGFSIKTISDMEKAARSLHQQFNVPAVVLKGGHLEGNLAENTNILFYEGNITHFTSKRFETKHTHGTGCTFASAIACFIAQKQTIPIAVEKATHYVEQAILHAPGFGKGHGPLNHMVEP